MKNLLFCVAMLLTGISQAKEEPIYPVSSIPEDMKTGMYAVIRDQESTFIINNRSNSAYKVRRVITILNPNARNYAMLTLGYDKFQKIENLKATVYDKFGKIIRKLKPGEIVDQSSVSDFSLFEDNRLKHIDLSQTDYPYTIEFEYTLTRKYLYSIPKFQLYDDDEITIQKSSFAIVYPAPLKPRYKVYKIGEPKITTENNAEKMTWAFENIKPDKFEKLAPNHNVIPNIISAPIDFEFDGYVGKMDTWDNLGKWQIQLNAGRDNLPELTKNKVKNLVRNASSVEEKVKLIYEYVQNKTRYVSIQRGIGGFQPFDATSVDQLGYGDCKALSNYMVALLKEVGIKGYYTQIYAGDDNKPVPKDFTIDYFNHIIVAVPNVADTIWLECTSQTNPFGYLGTFTGDRYALMITETGGALVKTPSYTAEQNVQSRIAEVFVDISGNAKAVVKTSYSGLQYENGGLHFYVTSSSEEQKKWLHKTISIPSFEVKTFNMINKKDKIPSAIVNVDLELKRWATVSGKRVFIVPNLMNRSAFVPEKIETRKTSFVIKTPYCHVDTIRYSYPEQLYPEFTPESVKVKSPFGEYEASYNVDQGKLIYIRKFRMNRGEFPPESYKEFSEFYKNVNKADNTKIVFMSKT